MPSRRLIETPPWAALAYKNMILGLVLTAAFSVIAGLVLLKHAQVRGAWRSADGSRLVLDRGGFSLDGRALRARYLPPLLFIRRERHIEVCLLTGGRRALWVAGYPPPWGLGTKSFKREGSGLPKR